MVSWSVVCLVYTLNNFDLSLPDVDPCARGVCKNGGSCSDLGGSKVECSCPPGFKGKTCEGKRHEFSSNFVVYKNASTCVSFC